MDVDEDSRPSPTPLRQGTATFGELARALGARKCNGIDILRAGDTRRYGKQQ